MKTYILCIAVLCLGFGCSASQPNKNLQISNQLVMQRSGYDAQLAHEDERAISAPAELDIDQAVALALALHPSIVFHKSKLLKAEADLVQAGLLPNPVFQLGVGTPIDGKSGAPMAASLMQVLNSIWTRPAKIRMAQAELESSCLSLGDAILQKISEVKSNYAELYFSRLKAQKQEELSRLLRQLVELEQRIVDAGESTQSKLNSLIIEQAQSEEKEIAHAKQCQSLEAKLAESIGLPTRQFLSLSGLAGIDYVGIDLETLLLKIGEQRLDVLAAFALVDSAKAKKELADWRAWPELKGVLAFQENFSDRQALIPQLSISIPIFDRGQGAKAKARAERKEKEYAAKTILFQALLQTQKAYFACIESLSRTQLYTDSLVFTASQDFEIAQAEFKAGVISMPQVIRSELRKIALEQKQLTAMADCHLSFFGLERASGGWLSNE